MRLTCKNAVCVIGLVDLEIFFGCLVRKLKIGFVVEMIFSDRDRPWLKELLADFFVSETIRLNPK